MVFMGRVPLWRGKCRQHSNPNNPLDRGLIVSRQSCGSQACIPDQPMAFGRSLPLSGSPSTVCMKR